MSGNTYTDYRLDFNQINTNFSNIFENDSSIINDALNIILFREKFNNMVLAFSNYNYYINNMLEFYNNGRVGKENYEWGGEDQYLINEWNRVEISRSEEDETVITYKNVLSDFILDMIIDVINSNSSDSDNFKVAFKNFFDKNNSNGGRGKNEGIMISRLNQISPFTKDKILTMIQDEQMFDLYFHILAVEKIQDISEDISLMNVYNIKNLIIMNILKYFYLSELFLKVLLDTNHNILLPDDTDYNTNDISSIYLNYNESNLIHADFSDTMPSNNVGMKLDETNTSQSEYCSNLNNQDGKIKQVEKIIKDIYLINRFYEENNLLFSNYFTMSNLGSDSGSNPNLLEIRSLDNNIFNINKNINKLNLKNLNIKKNYEKNRNIYYITIFFVVIYISINLFTILTKGPDSLLTLNGIIIVVILLTKFLQVISKFYQSLVKNFKN